MAAEEPRALGLAGDRQLPEPDLALVVAGRQPIARRAERARPGRAAEPAQDRGAEISVERAEQLGLGLGHVGPLGRGQILGQRLEREQDGGLDVAGTQLAVGDVDQEQRFGALRADPQLLRAIALLIGDRLLILRVVPEIAGARGHQEEHRRGRREPGQQAPAPALAGELVAPPAGLARPDELAVGLGEFGAAAAQPLERHHQGRLAQQKAFVARAPLPFLARLRQPLAPDQELAIGLDPVAQALPFADQRLVHDLGRGLAAGLVVLGDHQPGIGQAGDRRPVLVADLGAAGDPAGVLGALARAHELQEGASRLLPLGRTERAVDVLGIAGDRKRDAADLLVGQVGQAAVALALPQLGQREFQQRQAARLPAHVGEDAVDQPHLEAHALLARRILDRRPQLVLGHRPELQIGALERIGEGARLQRLAEEIGAQGQDHDDPLDPGEAQEHLEEALALIRPLAQGVDLLELVGDHQQPGRGRGCLQPADQLVDDRAVALEFAEQAADLAAAQGGVGGLRQKPEQGREQGPERHLVGAEGREAPAALGAQPRQEAGEDHRGLAAARRPEQSDQRAPAHRPLELGDRVVAAEEEGGIRLAKGVQPPIRARRHRCGRRQGRGPLGRLAGAGSRAG